MNPAIFREYDIRGLAGFGRYVRIFARQRGTQLGNYSLREIEVYP